MRSGSFCLDQALSLAFRIPVDRLLRGKAEFRGKLPTEDFPVSQRGRAQRTAAALLEAARRLSVEESCLQEHLNSPALPRKVLQTPVSGPFSCMRNCFMPNALSSEGGSQVFRCPKSQVFLHGKSMLNSWSLESRPHPVGWSVPELSCHFPCVRVLPGNNCPLKPLSTVS